MAAVARARRWLASVAPPELDRDQLGDAELVLSELVAHSVLHSGTDAIQVFLIFLPGSVAIEVRDRGPGLPSRRPGPAPQGGRGLLLVAAMSSSWQHGVADDGFAWVRAAVALGGRGGRSRGETV